MVLNEPLTNEKDVDAYFDKTKFFLLNHIVRQIIISSKRSPRYDYFSFQIIPSGDEQLIEGFHIHSKKIRDSTETLMVLSEDIDAGTRILDDKCEQIDSGDEGSEDEDEGEGEYELVLAEFLECEPRDGTPIFKIPPNNFCRFDLTEVPHGSPGVIDAARIVTTSGLIPEDVIYKLNIIDKLVRKEQKVLCSEHSSSLDPRFCKGA